MPGVPLQPAPKASAFTNLLCDFFGFWISLRVSRIRYPYQISEVSLKDPNLPLNVNLLMGPSQIQPQMELDPRGIWVTTGLEALREDQARAHCLVLRSEQVRELRRPHPS